MSPYMAKVIKLRILKWEYCPGLSYGPSVITTILLRRNYEELDSEKKVI